MEKRNQGEIPVSDKITICKDGDEIEIDLEDLEAQLDEQGYHAIFLNRDLKYFEFHGKDRDVIKVGHELREKYEGKFGYTIFG